MYKTQRRRYRNLKGSNHEIFEHGVFTQIRPVRVGDLAELGQKIQKAYGWGLIFIGEYVFCSVV
jgi:hypothetical protein